MTREINPNKITHIEHLDDMVLYNPSKCLQHLKNLESGIEYGTLKWDGSPSIVIGKGFVSTKSYFNKTPLKLSTYDEILAQNYSTELSLILYIALSYSSTISTDNVYQGDVMFCPGNKVQTENDITFGLNLIKYSVHKPDPDVQRFTTAPVAPFEEIKRAHLGIAFHTMYDSTGKRVPIVLPKSTDDVFIFDEYRVQLQAEPEALLDLASVVQEIDEFQKMNTDLDLYHDLFRKYKTQSLSLYNDVARYDLEGFEKFCFQCLSTKLQEGSYQARANNLDKMQKLNTLLKTSKKYFQNLCAFTYKAQMLVIKNLEELNKYYINAKHEGVVISTADYTIKYVNKYEFTKLNNAKRAK